MNKIIIPVITGILVLTIGLSQDIYAPEEPEKLNLGGNGYAKAVPDWIDNNFKWYGEGKIGQTDLLNSLTYMLDNNLMHLSDKAAQEMQSLREENAAYKKKLDADGLVGPNTSATSPDDQGRIKSKFNWDAQTEQESLNHLRKAYDLNPNLQTKVVQFDKDHDKWIDVLSIDWGSSSSTQGDSDRPVIVGRIYNTDSDDRPTEEVAFYYNKISFAHDTVDEIMAKGGTTSAWKDGIDKLSSIQGDSTVDSVVDDLQGVVVLCSTAIDKEILKIEAEIALLEELNNRQPDDSTARSGGTNQYGESDMEFIKRHAVRVEDKIQSLQTGLLVLEEKLATVGDDTQMANIDLQNTLQKQQQLLQMMSNISKSLHDTQMATIKNIG